MCCVIDREEDSRGPTGCHLLTTHHGTTCPAEAEGQKTYESEGVFVRWFVRSLGTLNALIELVAQGRAATSREGLPHPRKDHKTGMMILIAKSGSIGCFATPLKSVAVKEKNPERIEKMRQLGVRRLRRW